MADRAGESGTVVGLWRYPVKSMQGEELNALPFTERGAVGDRAYALLDGSTAKVASAKNPRLWAKLLDCRATLTEQGVTITLPDGRETHDSDSDLSTLFDRPVTLAAQPPSAPTLEEYWPDVEGLDHRETVTDEAMPSGTFYDLAVVHLLSTSTIDRLRELYPAGRFEVRRFRPNLIVSPSNGAATFWEDALIGLTLAIGDEVRLRITGPCPRCVMTTLPQSDLPRDLGILKTAVQHHGANVGVYAAVVRGGTVRRNDPVSAV